MADDSTDAYMGTAGDDTPTIVAQGSRPAYISRDISPKPYRGLTPLQAGLLYGGAAVPVMGPLAALVGLGAGILTSRNRQNYLDDQAKYVREVVGEGESTQTEAQTAMQYANPDQQMILRHATRMADEGTARLMNGDNTGRQLVDNANAAIQGVYKDTYDRHIAEQTAQLTYQRGMASNAAEGYKAEYQQNATTLDTAQQAADRVLAMVSSPGFDPNKPFNKAVLADTMQMGINGLYKENPDAYDAFTQGATSLEGAGRIGSAASKVAGGIATMLQSEQFKLTADDYNRVALNMKNYASKYANFTAQRLQQQAGNLDKWAASTQSLPQGVTFQDYVTGGLKELKMNPMPPPDAFAIGPPPSALPASNEYKRPMSGKNSQIDWTDITGGNRRGTISRLPDTGRTGNQPDFGLSESQARPVN